MRELIVVSGKGGTGKTSLVAAFASMAPGVVIADCDVDAADLHLLLHPDIKQVHTFEGGFVAVIDQALCTSCNECRDLCRYDAISETYQIDPLNCEGCGVCSDHCPESAIRMERETAAVWFESDTRFGPMIHARLYPAQENSGKLVAQIRTRAREIAKERNSSLILCDGSPGIGCPVISSITGADFILAVAEPTLSGRHDLKRVLELAHHFRIPTAVCVNKWDLNESITEQIRSACREEGAAYVGTIPYDPAVTEAMVAGKSITENANGAAAEATRRVWKEILRLLQ